MTADRRKLLTGAAALAATGAARSASVSAPDILFILADDLGYADLGCYGARGHATPVLDRLAAGGLRLTHAYASSAVCSATRTALITGRYPQRLPVGLEEPIPGTESLVGLPPEASTLPSRLRAAGYRTVLVGKWHLGAPPRYGPTRSGYDRFFGFYPGAMDYFRHGAAADGPFDRLYDQDTPVEAPGYLTDIFADRAVREIAAAPAGRPLFLSLHFNAPHWPWERPGDAAVASTLRELRHNNGGSLKIYGEMVQAMDAAFARVLAASARRGRETIVVFTSDNGGERFSDMWPFTGQKGELLEGGLRVPAIVRWPGRIRPGRTSGQVIASMDWLPTLLAAAGAPVPAAEVDGLDLSPQLVGGQTRPRRLFWRYKANAQAAVFDDGLKWLRLGGREHLFDVEADPHERADLIRDRPADLARLKAAYAAWEAQMLPYPADSFSETPKGRQADRY